MSKAFTPTTGLLDDSIYIDYPADPRGDIQGLLDQMLGFHNEHLADTDKIYITVTNPPSGFTAAVGDGVADDFAPIKALIESTDYPVVIIPEGTFKVKITSAITVPSNKTIIQVANSSIIVDPTTGNWEKFLTTAVASGISNIMIDGLKFDGNIANNVTGQGIVAGNGQYVIYFLEGVGENLTIKNCQIEAASINIIDVNVNVKNVLVENNVLEFVQKGSIWYDNSVIYMGCADYVCCNNIVKSSSANAQGGIEIHAGDAYCYGNIIKGFVDGINLCSPDATPSVNMRDEIFDNIIDCDRGINIWSLGAVECQNMHTHDNRITCTDWGIGFVQGTGAFKNSSIYDNYIFFPIGTTIAAVGAGHAGISLYVDADVDKVNIDRNTIVNPPYVGIMLGESDTYVKTNLFVCDNTIINPCADTTYAGNYKAAFFIPYSLTGIIKGNKILNPNDNTGISYRGIGTYQNVCVFADNVIPSGMTTSFQGWVSPVLQNDWVNADVSFSAAGYYKDSDRVYLKGIIKSGTVTPDTIIFTLPEGFRPSIALVLAVSSNNGMASIVIYTNGNVCAGNGINNTQLILEGLSFRLI
jgi:hypothetical protein